MTAFLELLNTYAIFFYLAGVVGVLFGIKMLFDARRAGRTTLFTLEQEQASDRAFRAVLVMAGATLFIGAVAGINAFVAPVIPTEPTDVVNPTAIPFTPPVFIASATPQPTLTLPPPTFAATAVPPTAAPAGPTSPPAVQPTAPAAQPTAPVEQPTVAPTEAPSAFMYMSPPLNVPPNGDSIGANRVRFSWGLDVEGNLAVPEALPADQFYRLAITYTDKTTNTLTTLPLCSHNNSVDQNSGVNVSEYRTEAVNSTFNWNVTVVQSPSQEACMAGQFTPLSPPSQTFTFILP